MAQTDTQKPDVNDSSKAYCADYKGVNAHIRDFIDKTCQEYQARNRAQRVELFEIQLKGISSNRRKNQEIMSLAAFKNACYYQAILTDDDVLRTAWIKAAEGDLRGFLPAKGDLRHYKKSIYSGNSGNSRPQMFGDMPSDGIHPVALINAFEDNAILAYRCRILTSAMEQYERALADKDATLNYMNFRVVQLGGDWRYFNQPGYDLDTITQYNIEHADNIEERRAGVNANLAALEHETGIKFGFDDQGNLRGLQTNNVSERWKKAVELQSRACKFDPTYSEALGNGGWTAPFLEGTAFFEFNTPIDFGRTVSNEAKNVATRDIRSHQALVRVQRMFTMLDAYEKDCERKGIDPQWEYEKRETKPNAADILSRHSQNSGYSKNVTMGRTSSDRQ